MVVSLSSINQKSIHILQYLFAFERVLSLECRMNVEGRKQVCPNIHKSE